MPLVAIIARLRKLSFWVVAIVGLLVALLLDIKDLIVGAIKNGR